MNVSDAYIFGGYNGTDIFGDLWRLDLDTLGWKKLPNDMAEPAYFHGTTITPVRYYLYKIQINIRQGSKQINYNF